MEYETSVFVSFLSQAHLDIVVNVLFHFRRPPFKVARFCRMNFIRHIEFMLFVCYIVKRRVWYKSMTPIFLISAIFLTADTIVVFVFVVKSFVLPLFKSIPTSRKYLRLKSKRLKQNWPKRKANNKARTILYEISRSIWTHPSLQGKCAMSF